MRSSNQYLNNANSKRQNYRLYKAKKQWITACTTVFLTLGASAVVTTSVHADTTTVTSSATTEVASQSSASSADATTNDTSEATSSSVEEANNSTADNQEASAVSATTAAASSATSAVATATSASTTTVDSATNADSTSSASIATVNVADLSSGSSSQDLQASKAATTDLAPEVITAYDPEGDDYGAGVVVAGTDMSTVASEFLSNADEIIAASGDISWDGDTPTATTEQGADNEKVTATIKVTYADGSTQNVDVGYVVIPRVTNNTYATGQSFYYVENTGDNIDLTTADSNGVTIANADATGNNLVGSDDYDYLADSSGNNITVTLDGTPDTSTIGFHYLNLKITTTANEDNSGYTNIIGGTYDIQVPYIVQTLATYSDDPTINVQKVIKVTDTNTNQAPNISFPTTGEEADAFLNNTYAFGRLVYQDYLQYFALGGKTMPSIHVFNTLDDPTTEFTLNLSSLSNSTPTTVKVNYVDAPSEVNAGEPIYMFLPSGTTIDTATQLRNYLRSSAWMQDLTTAKSGLSDYFTSITLANGQEAVPTGIAFSAVGGSKGQYKISNLGVYYGQNIDSSTGEVLSSSSSTTDNPAIVSSNSYNTNLTTTYGSLDLTEAQYQEIESLNSQVSGSLLWGSTAGNSATPTIYTGFSKAIDVLTAAGFSKTIDISNGAVTENLSDWTSYDASDSSSTEDKIVANLATTSKTYDAIDWPEGTTFKILDADGNETDGTSVTMDTPGEIKTVNVKITLPGGSSETVAITLTANSGVGYQFYNEYTGDDVGDQVNVFGNELETVNTGLSVPIGWELAEDTTLPTTVTIPKNSLTRKVIRIPVRQAATQTYQFVDADEDNTPVGSLITVSGYVGQTVTIADGTFTIPDNYELQSGTTLPTSVTFAVDSSTINIPLVHKTVTYNPSTDTSIPDGIDASEVTQTRTATLNYVYGTDVTDSDGNVIHKKGDQMEDADGNLIGPAVLDVYYQRSATKDLVTGEYTSYGNWQWDSSYNDDGYTNGYKVVSGTWTSLPTEWAPVVADVPTVSGYTAWTTTSQTAVPTNKFVYPTYVQGGTSDSTGSSTAYTTDADTYEAQAVHTVWYLPVDVEGRTITENFVKTDAEGNNDGEAASSIQAVVYFKREATGYDESTGTVTYGGYTWDTDAGDSSTPGIKILSGDTSLWKIPTSNRSWGINAPTLVGYTIVNVGLGQNGAFDTTVLGSPTLYNDTIFTNADSSTAVYYRNNITTYYVPTSALSKTLTRTINYYIGDATTPASTQTQTASFTRTASVNSDDSGIVFNNWSTASSGTDTWSSVDLTSGYANYVPTIDGKVTDTLSAVTVDPATGTDQTVDVRYILKAVNLGLSGEYSMTYDGSAATIPEDVISKVTENLTNNLLTMPDLSVLQLTTDDFSFTDSDGNVISAPTSAGTYHIILNESGLNKFKALDSTFTWNYDPTTSYATFVINKATPIVTINDAATKVYNGTAIEGYSPTFNVTIANDASHVDTAHLSSGDYEFELADGTWTTTAPVNVGKYNVRLTDQGATDIVNYLTKNDTAWANNIDWTNFTKDTPTATGQYVITEASANAVLTGQNGKTYDGNAVTTAEVDSNYSESTGIKVTISIPNSTKTVTYELQDGDYTWNTTDGTAPVDAGNYVISLNKDAIINHLQEAIDSYDNGIWKGNVTIAADDISGTAGYMIDKRDASATFSGSESSDYNGKPVSLVGYTISSSSGLKITSDDLSIKYTLKDGDYVFTQNGVEVDNPTDAGTYTVKLTEQGIENIKNKYSEDYDWNSKENSISGAGSYTINRVNAGATFAGSQEFTYTGKGVGTDVLLNNSNYTITYTGTPTPTASYTLSNTDYYFTNEAGQTVNNPTDAGTYTVHLTDTGLHKIETAGQPNYNWPNSVDVTATLTINPQAVTAKVTGTYERAYDGTDVANLPSTITLSIDTNGATPALSYSLQKGDYEYQQVNDNGEVIDTVTTPTNVGTYNLVLTAQGKKNIESLTDDGNYSWSDDSITSDAQIIITPVQVGATLKGSDSSTYTGSAIGSLVGNSNYTISFSGVPTAATPLSYTLQVGDYSFTDAEGNPVAEPTNVGTYNIVLTEAGIKHLETLGNGSYTWTTPTSSATYTINPAKPTAELSGTYTTTYTGNNVVADGLPSNITLNINTDGATPSLPYTLQAGDYEYQDASGNVVTAPTNAGTYNVVLTDQGKENISKLTDNGNYSWSNDQISSVAQVVISKANATATLSGDDSKTYDGTPIAGYTPTITISAPGNNSYTLTSGDYEFVPENSTTVTQTAPSNAGTYTVRLTAQGIANIKKVNADNLNWGDITGTASYVINKANATITLPVDSTQTVTWTGSTPTIDPSKFVPTISTTNKNQATIAIPSSVSLTASDYEIVDNSGNVITPTEVGTYKVCLTDAGWQKIQNAVVGNSNYNWNYEGTGTLDITKAAATISLSGTGSAMYTGSAINLDSDNLGTIKVTLSNGQTYDVTAVDLQFVDGSPTNVGTGYKVALSAEGLAKIDQLDSDHYTYEYDNSQAAFDVTKATATYQLTGEQSKIYDGQPAALTADGHYQVTITTNNGQQLTYTLTNDDLEFDTEDGEAPVNHGVYNVILTAAGIKNLQALNSNYNWTQKTSAATYDIKQAEMTVNLTGTASTVYNGQEQPLTQDQINDLKLTWAGSSTVPDGINSVDLTSDDIEYLEKDADGNWQVMTTAPIHATEEGKPYGIRLTETGLKKIQEVNADSNYTFILGDQVQATYTINQLKAQVTLKGYQTASYTKNQALDPSNFEVYLTNTADNVDINVSDNQYANHKLVDGDLEIEGYESSLPSEVGSYKVKITNQLIRALKEIFPDYDFDAYDDEDDAISAEADDPTAAGSGVTNSTSDDDVVAANNDGKYIITPIDAFITLTGSQTIKYSESDKLYVDSTGTNGYTLKLTDTYGNVIDGFTLTADDLEFVTKDYNIVDPKNVGNYEVTLTTAAMQKIDAIGKNSLGNMNYTWINQFTPATFTVEQMPVMITLSDKSSTSHPTITYGEDTTLDPNDYTISLKTENGNTLDYTLQDGDLAFEDGTPTTTGTFKVVLSEAGLKNIEDKYGTQNYTYTSTGNGLFTINAATPTVALTGNASQVYNGEAIPNYQVTATVTGPDTEQTITLSGDDLEYVDASGNVSTTAPVNVGNYTVQLSESGKKKVAAVNSSNLNWTDFDWTKIGTPTYDITKATATVTTTGSQSATYTGSPVKINLSDFVPTVSTNNGLTVTIPTDQVTAGDYEITDANGNVVTDPTAAGTYTVKLTADGLKKLESNTDNYDWTSTGQGTLTITPAVPAVTVDASASKVYDGSAIADYAPQVTITAPGASQVTLTSGDYEFNVDGTWTTTAPVNAGSYEVRLTDSGLAKIKAVNSTNFDWNNVTPAVSGDYTIEKADAVISLDDSQKQTASYTGSAAVIDPSYFIPSIEDTTNDKTLSASDLNLTASDYEFVDANGQAITAPTNKGTYYVRLTESGIQKVQDAVSDNSNYNWTYTGHGLYVIDESVLTITITATTGKDGKVYDGKPGEITSDGYTVTIKNPDGDVITTLDGSSLQFKDATTPTDVGTYQVELMPEAIEKLKEEYPNYNWDNASHVTGSYEISKAALTVNFTGSQTKPYTGQSQNYDPSGSVTITSNNGLTITVPELANSDLSYTPADHVNVGVYKVQLTQAALDNILNGVGSQNYTASFGTNEATLTITSEEGTVETKHVTRTIIFNLPNGTKPQIVQDAELSRTVTTEEPSGEVTYGEWNTGKWDAYTDILQVAGYTANPASIAEVSVNGDTANTVVEVNYTPNEQTGKISYVDNDTGKEITSTDLTGKTDETVPVDAESGVPAGWKSVPGQDIPTSVTATADGIPTVTVKIEHATIVVTPDDPKTPNDRLPDGTKTGDNYSNPGKYPSGVSESDLNRTVTRTINVMDPLTGQVTTTKQTTRFTRIATVDLVTGQVTYSDWIQSGENGWIEFTPMEVTGYTASPAVVPAEMVTADTKDATVVIKYSLNSKPEQPTNPDQPDNPNKPAQPTGPALPDQPREPAKPVQPNTPITPDNQGQANSGSQSSTVTTEGSNESSSTSPTSSMGATTKEDQSTDQQAKQLPQTGDEQNHSSLLGLLGLGFAGLLGLGKRKKKEDQ